MLCRILDNEMHPGLNDFERDIYRTVFDIVLYCVFYEVIRHLVQLVFVAKIIQSGAMSSRKVIPLTRKELQVTEQQLLPYCAVNGSAVVFVLLVKP